MEKLLPFEQWPYRVPDFDKAVETIGGYLEKFKNAHDKETALAVYEELGKFSDELGDDVTHIQVLFTLETNNEKYLNDMQLINEKLPLLQAVSTEFAKAMLDSPYRPYLEEKLGKYLFQMQEYALKGFDPCIIEELQKESDLSMQYDALVASVEVEYKGEKYNLAQIGKLLNDNDREVRKEASSAYYSALEKVRPQIEDIYDELVHVRDTMAKKLGYKNYVELGYIKMCRYDYDAEMVAAYREAIRKNVTPLYGQLIREQMERIGIKDPKIYDLPIMFKDGNPLPRGNIEEKVENAKKMYDAMSKETSEFFRFMVDHHLLFLEAKPGKQMGGYMTYFPLKRVPIIFSNFNGTSGDVDVLTHEFGHSFQAYLSRDIEVSEYRSPTMESCEIHSMSMEFFAEPYMDLFFDNPEKYRYEHLASSINFLPYGVTVDEFQHWVYEHPYCTKEERNQAWHEIELKYTPEKVEIEKDCPYLMNGGRWLTQGHIFSSPFYYIDYTLAQVMAFQFFNLDRADHKKAWDMYIGLCKLGGRYPFCQLVKEAGLEVPFEEGVLEKTIAPLKGVLDSYKF